MIKSVTVTNPKGESLLLELMHPEKSGLYIKDIEGIGPPKATINATEIASIDGSMVSSTRAVDRNVVFTLGMLESPQIEDARQKTYRYFPIKKPITMRFETDNRTLETTGYVESNEPDIFSKEESTQISIICPDPWMYAPAISEVVFSGTMANFEFPFSNESLTEPKIEFGIIRLDTRANLVYSGDVDTGIEILIHCMGPAEMINIYNVDTYETMKIDTDKLQTITGKPLATGDDILISTIQGHKSVRLLRDGVYTNIISALNKDANWFQLSTGDNTFAFTARSGEEDIIMTFTYHNAYGGI